MKHYFWSALLGALIFTIIVPFVGLLPAMVITFLIAILFGILTTK